MADDVWAWCEKTKALGRTVTVKIKYADFQIATRSRTFDAPVASREALHDASLHLVRSVYPLSKGIRLVGVTLSSFGAREEASEQLSLALAEN
jgi:DNA polymerase-4